MTMALTERERDVLQAMADLGSVAKVSEHLRIAPNTVSVHLATIRLKLRVDSTMAAVVQAMRNGLIT